jgi:ABC-type glycerol-3-phosphate transport system substrate-binding protein
LNFDNEENIYFASTDSIYIFDSTGSLLFDLDVRESWNYQLIRMPDGGVAYFDGRGTIRKIDTQEHGWGDTINLPHGTDRVFNGIGEFDVIFISGMALYGVKSETNEIELVLDFVDADLIFDRLLNIEFLADGRVIAVTFTVRKMLTSPELNLIILNRAPNSGRQERIELTLAGIDINGLISSAVVQFNTASNTHRIHIVDYSIFNTSADDNQGITRLTIEIVSGRIPDIIALSGLPFRQYAARGLFADLGVFLDNDPEINREDLIESVLRAAETDGILYRISPTFYIYSIIGNPKIIGSDQGWTVEEFKAVLDANPEADIPMGLGMSKMRFLHFTFTNNIEQFIDWNSGTAYFDDADFAQLLELADMFPMEADQDVYTGFGAGEEEIAAGRQIMAWRQLHNFDAYRFNRTMYGSEIVFKGFPGENRTNGIFTADSNVAISSQSENQQAAWEFVRLMLSEDFGRVNIHRSFPMSKTVFEERLVDAMIPDGRRISLYGGVQVDIDEISAEEAVQIWALIDSISSVTEHDEMLWNIISESASDFFNGRNNVQDAARIIQSRVSTYMSEQS